MNISSIYCLIYIKNYISATSSRSSHKLFHNSSVLFHLSDKPSTSLVLNHYLSWQPYRTCCKSKLAGQKCTTQTSKRKITVKYPITSLYHFTCRPCLLLFFIQFFRIYLHLYFCVICVHAFQSLIKYQKPCYIPSVVDDEGCNLFSLKSMQTTFKDCKSYCWTNFVK